VEALDIAEQAPDEVQVAVESVVSIVSGDATPDDIDLENSGYVVTTLQAGLYHGLTAETAEDVIIDAVMMGGDTDTIGAVTGAVAGARFGKASFPSRWINGIQKSKQLTHYSEIVENKSLSISKKTEELYTTGKLT
jgi:ADP-ribosyl-[dinitrogen reductase] hydrolase